MMMILSICDYCKREIYALEDSIMIIIKERLWIYHPNCYESYKKDGK